MNNIKNIYNYSGIANTGRHISEEHKRKVAESNRRRAKNKCLM
jgi:hypothetical protein